MSFWGRKEEGETPPSNAPVWKMNDQERVLEQVRRLKLMAEQFEALGGEVSIVDETIHLSTPKNNYFVDVAAYDPRFIKMTVIYEVVPGDLDRASWAAYNAQALTHAAKAKALPHENGYRLNLTTEVFAVEVEHFTAAIGLYQAVIEDCREKFAEFLHQAIQMEEVCWSAQPPERQS